MDAAGTEMHGAAEKRELLGAVVSFRYNTTVSSSAQTRVHVSTLRYTIKSTSGINRWVCNYYYCMCCRSDYVSCAKAVDIQKIKDCCIMHDRLASVASASQVPLDRAQTSASDEQTNVKIA